MGIFLNNRTRMKDIERRSGYTDARYCLVCEMIRGELINLENQMKYVKRAYEMNERRHDSISESSIGNEIQSFLKMLNTKKNDSSTDRFPEFAVGMNDVKEKIKRRMIELGGKFEGGTCTRFPNINGVSELIDYIDELIGVYDENQKSVTK